jgi:enterochelin esterase-like enzyme
MVDDLLNASLIGGPLSPIVFGLTIALFVALFALSGTKRRVVRPLGGGAAGAVVALVITWLAIDVFDVIGVDPSVKTRLWVVAVGAGLGFATVCIVQGPWSQRVVGILAAVAVVFSGALGINIDVGYFPTLRVALGLSTIPRLDLDASPHERPPATGIVGSQMIPGKVSHFPAREAVIYVPPAARVANPRPMPVLVMLSGQPGAPSDIVAAGRVGEIMDNYASKHDGVAPIVVIPDQLGSPNTNPMCVDGARGNTDTYLAVDVPAWIRAHFSVLPSPSAWTIGGYSQGGTCSIQLGAGHPDVYGNILDVAGERVPGGGIEKDAIAGVFAHNRDAYVAAWPENVLKKHAPYADSVAVFAVGANDGRFALNAKALTDAAKAAGMHATYLEVPGASHDWATVQFAITNTVSVMVDRSGITAQ